MNFIASYPYDFLICAFWMYLDMDDTQNFWDCQDILEGGNHYIKFIMTHAGRISDNEWSYMTISSVLEGDYEFLEFH